LHVFYAVVRRRRRRQRGVTVAIGNGGVDFKLTGWIGGYVDSQTKETTQAYADRRRQKIQVAASG